jgi:hypothetical protein
MIDIDSLASDGDSSDQQAMLSYATQQLPVEFQSVDFWYQFSSSMGIKSGIRVHLWFWFDRPCSDDEMKAWLSGCPVDMRMFNPIQIHLTANPFFIDGAIDPYPNRAPIVVNVFYHTASKIVWGIFSLYFFGLLLDASCKCV